MKPQNKTKIIPLTCKSYMATIKNSIGTKMFRNFYAKINGQKKDVLENGELSCAFFASAILHLFQLIKEPHRTVVSTIKDMEESGWYKIKKIKPGSVLMWEDLESSDKGEVRKFHKHLGFYIDGDKAVSNSSRLGRPKIHHLTYGIRGGKPVRRIETIYWHKKLDK